VLLEDHYRSDEVCYGYYPADLAALSHERMLQYRLFRGHFGGAVHSILRRPVNAVSWLRSPLGWLVSNYNFRIQEHVIPESMRLEEWLEMGGSNPICGFLTSGARFAGDEAALSDFTKARAVLLTCFLIGTVERHDDSLNLLSYHLGAYPPELSATLNRSQGRPHEHASGLDKQIAAKMRGDLELYAWAQARLQTAVTELAATLRADAAARLGMRELPATEQVRAVLRHRFFDKQLETPLSEEIDYTFDQPLIGEGWYERQPGDANSLIGCIRGIAGDNCRATLYLPIARDRPCVLRFGVARVYAPQALKGLQVRVNGVPVALKRDGRGHPRLLSETTFRAEIPPEALQRALHLSRVTFVPGGSIVPAEKDPLLRDTSALTLALNWVSVRSSRR
jgi:hypothetical protein